MQQQSLFAREDTQPLAARLALARWQSTSGSSICWGQERSFAS